MCNQKYVCSKGIDKDKMIDLLCNSDDDVSMSISVTSTA